MGGHSIEGGRLRVSRMGRRLRSAGVLAAALVAVAAAAPGRHWVTALDPASGASAQAPVRVEDPWPQARGGPTLGGLNGAESAIGSLNASTLTEVWREELGEPSPSEPSIDGAGRAFV